MVTQKQSQKNVEIDPTTGAPVKSNPTNQFTAPNPASTDSTDETNKVDTTGDEVRTERPTNNPIPDNRPNKPPFNNPPTNLTSSQNMTEAPPNASFAEKEQQHVHATLNTPNTTMSGGPFNPNTFDTPTGETRGEGIPMPVKTYVRHPTVGTGEPATPVALQEKALTETEVDQKIADILKNNGMDSASQLRAFSEIKSVLHAWEPNPDTDIVMTAPIIREQEQQQREEASSEQRMRDQAEEDKRNQSMSDEERKAKESEQSKITSGTQTKQTVKA